MAILDAATLLEDFWAAVEEDILKEEGVPSKY